jgi:hypothetical protein
MCDIFEEIWSNRVIDTISQVIDMLFSRPDSASSQISNFNLRTGILITGCMACGGGRLLYILSKIVHQKQLVVAVGNLFSNYTK